jgi:hypothetical protein
MNDTLFNIDNKERIVSIVSADDSSILRYIASTNKYHVVFTISSNSAEAQITRSDGKLFKFTYHNHVNSYPYASSYSLLISQVRRFVNLLRVAVFSCPINNIFVNGVQVCPTASTPASAASGGEVADGGGDVGEAGGV